MYHSLDLDKATPKTVKRLIQNIEKRYIKEAHTILRLPVASVGLHSACNTAAFLTLSAVVGGISTALYPRKGNDREKYTRLLRDYYPWQLEPKSHFSAEEASNKIYQIFRNPLIHDLGLDLEKKKSQNKVVLKRRTGLNDIELSSLESSSVWPECLKYPTLKKEELKITLSVEAFYWGVRHTIENLSRDEIEMRAAEAFLCRQKKT